MAALTCDICGGKLIMQTGALVKCESCGMEYTKERMQEKVQEIKGIMCDKYGLSDRILIWLVANRCFIIVEMIVWYINFSTTIS